MANKHMKIYSTSLIITKMQIKTTVKKETARSITSHQSEWSSSKKKNLQTINVGEGVKKREPSCSVGNVN